LALFNQVAWCLREEGHLEDETDGEKCLEEEGRALPWVLLQRKDRKSSR
jgi:hypothetical protein